MAVRSVDEYIEGAPSWRDALRQLRRIVLDAGLEESIKWGMPCYTRGGSNLIGMAAFKRHFALWFHHGVLLPDPAGVLTNAQEGKTRALRQWRFTEASFDEALVASYVRTAVEIHERGESVAPRRSRPVEVPRELAEALAADPEAAAAFDRLAVGCRREYAEHVAEAKRPETRLRRAEKAVSMIRAGDGLNDRHRTRND